MYIPKVNNDKLIWYTQTTYYKDKETNKIKSNTVKIFIDKYTKI